MAVPTRTGAQTAQVAAAQGKYLGKKLSKLAASRDTLEQLDMSQDDPDDTVSEPFRYKHMGSLAYLGNSAVRPDRSV